MNSQWKSDDSISQNMTMFGHEGTTVPEPLFYHYYSAAIFLLEKPCLDSEVYRHSLSLGNRACSSNPEAQALSAWCILLLTVGRNQTRWICWAGKNILLYYAHPGTHNELATALNMVFVTFKCRLVFSYTSNALIDGAEHPLSLEKSLKMYLKIDRSVKTTPWPRPSMGVASFRMRAFKIHNFLIGHNAPCPKIRCIMVYVKMTNHIVHVQRLDRA